MKYLLLLSICFVGCAVDIAEEDVSQAQSPLSIQHYAIERPTINPIVVSFKPPCKPDTFFADSIPAGYIMDPDCPPNIIWPPKFIFPNDPGPIINVVRTDKRETNQ